MYWMWLLFGLSSGYLYSSIYDGINGARNWGPLKSRDESLAKNCVDCGLCETQCTQHLPIIERLQECAEVEIAK